jgi:putative DNA primase/helicase
VTIEPSKRDPNLTKKLKDEWPGILQWALDGCAAWQKTGLTPPEAVTKATAAYLEAEDAVSAWIQERCEWEGKESLAKLYASWRSWAESNGEDPRSNKWLADVLATRGTDAVKSNRGKQILGLRLVATDERDGHWWNRE